LKKYMFFILIVIVIIIFFLIFNYKKFLNGNNIIKQNQEEIVDNILSNKIKYKAEIKVKINSNKNRNEYNMIQEENDTHSYLEVTESGELNGLIIENINNKLTIRNTKLNLEKIYEDYKAMTNNCLFLSSFGKEYIESQEIKKYEEEDCIVVKIKIKNSNKYIKYKELYLEKNTGIPRKLIIKNSDKQEVVCIEYINIEIM